MTTEEAKANISPAENEIVGAVLVAGGGIGGMQAALDLAEAGFKVYLQDTGPAIGGTMAKLDKTFPTNECAMCIMAPKLVECGRHRNIELLTYSEIEGVEGSPGHFKVTLTKKARFIDEEKCTGCGECEKVCPVEIKSEFDAQLANRRAIYRLYPQAVPRAYTIDRGEEVSPCRATCPAHVNPHAYVRLISQGKLKEALEVVRRRNPFPGVCGRICHHPCEDKCLRGEIDQPIAICDLKRFAADQGNGAASQPPPLPEQERPEKVAVVGSGPAGLTAAYDLRLLGYGVTVFESERLPGGMPALTIPEFRLPASIVQSEVQHIQSLGVEIRTGVKVGRDVSLDSLFDEGYEAIVLAIGTGVGRSLRIPGADAEGVLNALDFLRDVKLGRDAKVQGRVVVVGGGGVAMDAARTAIRLGAQDVHIACLESREEMPAHSWEIEAADEEIRALIEENSEANREAPRWHTSVSIKRIVTSDGRVSGIELMKVKWMKFDEEGRLTLEVEEGREQIIPADTVILAVGQSMDRTIAEVAGIPLASRGTIAADSITLECGRPGVFAAGDAVSGPSSVIEAIAAGHEAAVSVDRYLRGEDLRSGRPPELVAVEKPRQPDTTRKPRRATNRLPAAERIRGFAEVDLGFDADTAVAEAARCMSCAVCSECLQCQQACEADAVVFDQKEQSLALDVGAIIAVPGFDVYDAAKKGEYGFGLYENVVTSIQFERILSASGPSGGEVVRPSDGAHPKKIAFIQCVGSRDNTADGNDHCSSICCMYSTKEAIIAREHDPEIQPTIFFIDLRAFGKEFEKYYESAKNQYGITYHRCMISKVVELQRTKNLRVKYITEDGAVHEEEFDLVVLAVGLVAGSRNLRLAESLGISLDEHGFCEASPLEPNRTSRPGIFAAGPFLEPKDIPETVVEASAAAASASRLLAPARGRLVVEKEYPPEIDVSEEEPRIGVFVCRCGRNIGGIIDVPAVVEYARTLPDVAFVDENLYTCSQDSLVAIKEKVVENRLNRVAVASCTPRTHEMLFRDTIREVGLNPYLFEMCSLREQCSWVHMNQPGEATEKAKEIVRMAVAKARLLRPIQLTYFDLNHKCLVIGGGLAGMTAALSLADQGFDSYLVEKEVLLGGNLRNIRFSLSGYDPQLLLRETIEKVTGNPRIQVFTGAEVVALSGYVGNFKTIVRQGDQQLELEHGAIIVATGASEHRPTGYLYGQNPSVLTQEEFEEKLASDGDSICALGSIVMIQCVGSRDDERPYCSRVCCGQAIKNALKLKELNPEAAVFILYRDVRTYGFKERAYREAREKGIVFLRYEDDRKPTVSEKNGKPLVELTDSVLGEKLLLEADCVVLSTGMVTTGNEELAKILKVPLTSDGFFLEAHAKIRPLDFATDGMYVCGLAHSPKYVEESIAQANGAAIRAVTLLSKEKLISKAEIVRVNEKVCTGCAICVSVCPYDAREIDDETKKAKIVYVLCQGCGACAAACPNGATVQNIFEKEQILEMVDSAIG